MMQKLNMLAQTISQNDLVIPKTDISPASVSNVLQLVFAIAGAVALIIVILAGLQFTLVRGDPQASTKARSTIIYALIGLLVCITAFSIVSFVVERV